MSSQETCEPGIVDFGILLNVAFGTFKTALHEHLAGAGFTDLGGSFGYIVRTLEMAPHGMSLKDLANALAVTPQGTLKIVDDMVAKAYVSRTVDAQDSRVKRLSVAQRGEALLREARRFHRQYEKMLADQLGPQHVASTRRVLESLVGQSAVSPGMRMQLL